MSLFDIVSYMDDIFSYSVYDIVPKKRNIYHVDTRVEKRNGITTYYESGKLSRLGGPAIEYDDTKQECEYWYEGKKITKEEHDKLYMEKEDNKLYTIYIDGQYKQISGKKMRLLKQILEE